MYNFIKQLIEGKVPKTLEQTPLPYTIDALSPALGKDAVNFHYNKLYHTYVERFNKGEGDLDFNEAGAFLHSIYFSQLQPFDDSNPIVGPIADFIKQHFSTFGKFKENFEKVAMGIQGAGWVYLSTDGKIKTITNHEIKQDILILIDWWEHSWVLDYQADKKTYLENQWKIMNWDFLNSKLENKALTQ